MIVAMACGTPVVAFRSGSVPEAIDPGVTGFIVEDEDDAVAAIKRLAELDRRTVRARFEERFSAKRMAQDYVRNYEILTTPPLLNESGTSTVPDHKQGESASSLT
jgi:glycosyltransferase involved in cell wall biosynthesis